MDDFLDILQEEASKTEEYELPQLIGDIQRMALDNEIPTKFRDIMLKKHGENSFSIKTNDKYVCENKTKDHIVRKLGQSLALMGCKKLPNKTSRLHKILQNSYNKQVVNLKEDGFSEIENLYWKEIQHLPGHIDAEEFHFCGQTLSAYDKNKNISKQKTELYTAKINHELAQGTRKFNDLTEDYFNFLKSLPWFIADKIHPKTKNIELGSFGININGKTGYGESKRAIINKSTETLKYEEFHELTRSLESVGILEIASESQIFKEEINKRINKRAWQNHTEIYEIVDYLNKNQITHDIHLRDVNAQNVVVIGGIYKFHHTEIDHRQIAKAVINSSGSHVIDIERARGILPLPKINPMKIGTFHL